MKIRLLRPKTFSCIKPRLRQLNNIDWEETSYRDLATTDFSVWPLSSHGRRKILLHRRNCFFYVCCNICVLCHVNYHASVLLVIFWSSRVNGGICNSNKSSQTVRNIANSDHPRRAFRIHYIPRPDIPRIVRDPPNEHDRIETDFPSNDFTQLTPSFLLAKCSWVQRVSAW